MDLSDRAGWFWHAEIRARKWEIAIEFKDLDEVTLREDICISLKEQLNLRDI